MLCWRRARVRVSADSPTNQAWSLWGGAWIQFNIRYYMFALVFVIFDVETVFLYPWAVAFHRLGLLAFIEALVFIAILVVALAYAWRKGALEWS